MKPNEFVEMSFHEAADVTARKIYAKYPKLYLALSGGADSDYVFRCLTRNNIPFEPILVRTSGNTQELAYAFHLCKMHNIKPIVLELPDADILEIYFEKVVKGISGYGLYCIPALLACNYAKEHDGVLIIGEHMLDTDKRNGNITPGMNEWDFYNELFVGEKYNIPFFNYTTELCYAMTKSIPENKTIDEFKWSLYNIDYRPIFDYTFNKTFEVATQKMKSFRRGSPDPHFGLGTKEEFLSFLEPFKRKPLVPSLVTLKQLHCGYYIYNNKMYINRQELLDDMLIYGNAPVQYYYNENVFKSIDWTIEPDVSLKDLYRERAQQLRDTYEYIILSYSGGADSHEVLGTFLENNIFIDEIQVVHHYDLIKKIDKTIMMGDPALKMLLEFEMAAAPIIKRVKDKSPNTKITLLDASEFIVDDIIKHKFDFMGMGKFNVNSSFIMSTTPYVRNFFQQHHNSKYVDTGKKTCFLRGTEKPNIRIRLNTVQFHFTDASMNTVKLIQLGEIPEIYTVENFFWSPDAPLIPIKQSHVIKKALERDRNFYAEFMMNQDKLFLHNKQKKFGHDQEQNFQRRYNHYIYYHWNDQFFKAPKHGTESPEFRLIKTLTQDNSPKEALKEQNEFLFKKYDYIENKQLLNRHMMTEPYDIGELNVSWY